MDAQLIGLQNIKLYAPNELDQFLGYPPKPPKSPSEWFYCKYPKACQIHGPAFVELHEPLDAFTTRILPLTQNIDTFAAILGGRGDLGHLVVYLENEMEFYFYDCADKLFKPVSQDKLANQYRALLMKCAEEMPGNVQKLNLCHEFRSDKTSKSVVQRAKSILAASSDFFSATSPHQRIKGPELYERLMRVLVETMLERRDGACLTVTQAYQVFCQLSQQRSLGQLKRSMFKETMKDLVRDVHGLGLRRDVPDSYNKQQEAWKGLSIVDDEALAA